MKKTDEDAIKWAIRKYWKEKTDAELATGLKVSEEKIKEMREDLGFARDTIGKESMKDFARRYLLEMSEEMKTEFMKKLSPELIWKMAEGQPATTGSLEIGVEPIRIDISHQLLKVYGPPNTPSVERIPEYSETSG